MRVTLVVDAIDWVRATVSVCVSGLRDERVWASCLVGVWPCAAVGIAPLCWRRRTSRFCVPAALCVRAVCLLCVYLGGQHEITRPANYSPPSYSASKELLA